MHQVPVLTATVPWPYALGLRWAATAAPCPAHPPPRSPGGGAAAAVGQRCALHPARGRRGLAAGGAGPGPGAQDGMGGLRRAVQCGLRAWATICIHHSVNCCRSLKRWTCGNATPESRRLGCKLRGLGSTPAPSCCLPPPSCPALLAVQGIFDVVVIAHNGEHGRVPAPANPPAAGVTQLCAHPRLPVCAACPCCRQVRQPAGRPDGSPRW